MKLSVVIPVYNSEKTIDRVVQEVLSTLGTMDLEVVLVNDGSRDASEAACMRAAAADSRVKSLGLRKNFGEHNAVLCGLNFATGDVAAILDDDLQHPPEEVLKLLAELEKGFDVVFGHYQEKKHSGFRNWGSWFNDQVANYTLHKPAHIYLSSFKVLRREVIREVIKYRGPFPYLDGLLLRVTNNVSSVIVGHRERVDGVSNYTFRKLVRLWLNTWLNFSVLPLRIFTLIGFFSFALGLFLAFITLLESMWSSRLPQGYASLFIGMMIFSGTQLMSLGLIGEYLGKQYLDQNGTPQWIIRTSSFPVELRDDHAR